MLVHFTRVNLKVGPKGDYKIFLFFGMDYTCTFVSCRRKTPTIFNVCFILLQESIRKIICTQRIL